MAQILSGKAVAVSMQDSLKTRSEALRRRGVVPLLKIIRCGQAPGDLSYERGIMSVCGRCGIEARRAVFPEDAGQDKVISEIRGAGADPLVHGVLLLRPLPAHMDSAAVENSLAPEKDVDCMTDISLGAVFTGGRSWYRPCTPEAVLKILDHYGISCEGKNAVIVGRSLVFGKPMAMMLLERNATVTICHSRTKDLSSVTRQADILIAAAGHAGTIGPEHVSGGQTVIDVGINTDENGKLCGDVSFEAVMPLVSGITPVPGGVGAVTSSVLAEHVIRAAEKQSDDSRVRS